MPDANGVLSRSFVEASEAIRVTGAGTGGTTTVVTQPTTGALTDRSGTITTGGTAQNAAAANASRRYLLVRNPLSAAQPLYFNLTGMATADSPSMRLDPGDTFVMEGLFVASNAVSVLGATTGNKFTVWDG